MSPVVDAFFLHQAAAYKLGCQLATASDQAELDLITAAVTEANPNRTANSDSQPLAWIGFGRPLLSPDSWGWLDGCAPFNTTFFATTASPPEPNANGAISGASSATQEPLGAIWYASNGANASVGQLGNAPQYYR